MIVELDWTETFFRMLDLILELIESPLDWIGEKIGLDFGFYRAMVFVSRKSASLVVAVHMHTCQR